MSPEINIFEDNMADKRNGFENLRRIIDKLRGPEGCPWDKKQTHESLKPFLVEESYEVLQAIDDEVPEKLCDELGDLLLQIMLHAKIADEAGEFNIEDVIEGISLKLIHRHPHVFGKIKAKDEVEVEKNWETLKQRERGEGESILSGVPEQMPALAYSQSIQRRVAGVGFDWKTVEEIIDKLAEEVGEIKQANSQEEKAKEFGDLIFTIANIARRLGIDLEMALRAANRRFYKRFIYMEKMCRERGIEIDRISLDEQNRLWEEAKRNEG
jgi:tetrapyrrole methylase family protein/MazG family protein